MDWRGDYFGFYFQVGDYDQDKRGHNTERKITENNRQDPCECPGVTGVVLRGQPPHNYRSD